MPAKDLQYKRHQQQYLEGKDGRRTSYRRWLSFSGWTDGTVRQAREMSVGVVGGIRIVSHGALSREEIQIPSRASSVPEEVSPPLSPLSRGSVPTPPRRLAPSSAHSRGRFKSRDGTRGPFTPTYHLAARGLISGCTRTSP
jgi:hypothetical protein